MHPLGRFTIRSIAVFTLAGASAFASNDEVARWNRVATDTTAASEIGGNPLASRGSSTQVAVHDAVNSIDPWPEVRDDLASVDAAVATATCDARRSDPVQQDCARRDAEEALARSRRATRSRPGSRSAGAAILALRARTARP
jgi:hypothetical protein